MKEKVITIGGIIFVVLTLAVSAGLTYSFFTASVGGNEQARETVVETALLRLRYTDGPEIEALQVLPGWSKSKTFTVENIGTEEVSYTIWWKELYNTFMGDELVMSLGCKRINGEGTEEGTCAGLGETVIGTNASYPIKSSIKIEENITHEYTFTIKFKETGSNQNYNQGSIFSGIIQINEYDEFEYTNTQIQNVEMRNHTLKATLTNPNKIEAYALTYNKEEEEMLKSGVQPYNLRSGGRWIVVEPTGTLEIEETLQDYEVKLWAKSVSGNITYEDLTPNDTLIIDAGLGTYNGSTGIKTYSLRYKETKTVEDPEREGYTFTEWSLVGGEVSKLENKVFTMGIAETKLTANYTPNKYKLTINPNGGNYNGSTSVYEEEKETDSTKEIANPEREGYTFTGWDITGTCELNEKTLTMKAGECTIKATWQVNTYKWIVYHNQMTTDGTGYTLVDSDSGEEEYQKTITLPLKTYTGFTSPNEKTMTIKSDESKNTDEYNYTRNKYDLVINPAGGTYNGGTSNVTTKEYYGSTKTIASPSRIGYTFNGWTKTGNSTLTDSTLIIGNEKTTLEAKWTANQYEVSLNLNDGSGTINKINVTYDSQYGTFPSTPSKTGYTFAGWYTSKSGGNKIESTTVVTNAGNHTLYAQWTANIYTLNLTKGTGVDSITAKGCTAVTVGSKYTCTYGASVTVTATASSGYAANSTLKGTNISDKTNGTAFTMPVPTSGTSVTLAASATANIYTISLNKDGGTGGTSTIYLKYGTGWYSNSGATTTLTKVTTPTKEGYSFQGYYTGANGTGTQIIDKTGTILSGKTTIATSAKTLYAYWETLNLTKAMLAANTAQSDSSINFGSPSAEDGTNGLYYTSNTTKTENGEVVYYYRGAVTNNYVVFGNYCWRIVRTVEDGSVRLRYGGTPTQNGETYTCPQTGTAVNVGSSFYNTLNNNQDHADYKTSSIRTVIENWYRDNIWKNGANTKVTNLIADTPYCNDMTFGAYKRLYANKSPQYKCEDSTYGYTVAKGDITYPIALLTADEVAYAGGTTTTVNKSYYLYTGEYYWTMSPFHFTGSTAYVFDVASVGGLGYYYVNDPYAAVPVVSLKPEATVKRGTGAYNDPYVINTD